MVVQKQFDIRSAGRGTVDVTEQVAGFVSGSGISSGLCNVFLMHTSASLVLCENADPEVRRDLERFMGRLVPDGDELFHHTAEGPDDMPAHLRSMLTGNSITLPVVAGKCRLGTWQGLYLWEHRHDPHTRTLALTIYGE